MLSSTFDQFSYKNNILTFEMQKQNHKDKMNKMCRVTSNYDSSQLKLMKKKNT
jgi:hypothetical protein